MTEGPPPTGMADPVGRVLGDRWRIDGILASGGQAVVLVATEVRRVDDRAGGPARYEERGAVGTSVVKVTELATGAAELKFHETSHHQHLVTYKDTGEVPAADPLGDLIPNRRHLGAPLHWLAMPRAIAPLSTKIGESVTGSVVSADRPLPIDACVELWKHLLDALSYLNEQRRVHGDIKPGNVLEFAVRSGREWRLTDFGLMVDLDTNHSHAPWRGATPAFASPSVLANQVVRPRDDRYSAALTVHLAATGTLPEVTPTGRRVADGVPPQLRDELQRAIDLVPDESDHDASREVRTEPVAAAPPRRSSPGRQTTTWWGVVAALGVVGALLGAWLWFRSSAASDDAGAATTSTVAAPDQKTATTVAGAEAGDPAPGDDRDDTLLFARRASGSTVIVETTDGGGSQSPLALDAADPTEPSINADGDLAFITEVDGKRSIAVGRIGSPTARTFTFEGGAADPAISPDGTAVAFTTEAGGDEDVAILDLSTGTTRTLAGGSSDEFSASWSPDGQKIAIVRSGSEGDTVLVLDAASGDQRSITGANGAKDTPTWSPDGTTVAFVGTLAGSADVFTVASSGDGTPTIAARTDENELASVWCANGIVTSASRQGLTLIDPAAGTASTITDGAGDTDPACSP